MACYLNWYQHIRALMKGDWKTNLSAYWDDTGTRRDVTDKDISEGLNGNSRNTNQTCGYTFIARRWRQCAVAKRVQRHTMARRNL